MFTFTLFKKTESENEILRRENKSLRSSLDILIESLDKKNKKSELVAVDMGDPVPQKTSERKPYIARVAAFHIDVLKPKLLYMISNTHALLEEGDHSRDDDYLLKAVAYVCRELIAWGEQAVNEQMSYSVELEDDAPSTVEENLEKLIKS